MSQPILTNADGLAPVRDADGPQEGEILELPEYDEAEGRY